MNKVRTALVTAAAMGFASQASAYDVVADVTFNWAASGSEAILTSQGTPGNFGTDFSNETFFSDLATISGEGYLNPDFADDAFFATTPCVNSASPFASQYACQIAAPGSDTVAPTGLGPGPSASGLLNVTSTTMTGVLTVIPDPEGLVQGPQAGTSPAGAYNIRSADGSPFKNVWYGISEELTLNVNLTGTFNETDWNITGGNVVFNDPNFQCAIADFSGVLCSAGQLGDGEGSIRSWGENTASISDPSQLGEIDIFDPTGATLLETLSGVLANLTIDTSEKPLGEISTVQGEYRRGGAASACATGGPIRVDPGSGTVTCGTLVTGTLNVTGHIVPVPAAVWLFGSALGLLGWVRRRTAA